MPAIYLIAALVAVVWGTLFLLRGSLLGGCLAYLVATTCFGYDFAHFMVGPVPLSIDRIVLVVLFAAYVVQRRLGRTQRQPPARADLVAAALLGVLAASTLWSAVPADSKSLGFRLLGGYAVPLAIYWIARQIPLDRGRISLLHGVLAGLGVYLGVTGVLEITGQWWAVFPAYIADPNVGLHFGRARGPMVHAVSFGLYLGIGLLAAWLWQWRFGRLGRLLVLLPAPIMVAGLYGSYTRSVWIGAVVGILLVLGLTLRGQWRTLVVGSMIAAALLLAVTKMDSLVNFDRELPAAYAGKSVELRGEMAYVSWKMFLGPPLVGCRFRSVLQSQAPLPGRPLHQPPPRSHPRPGTPQHLPQPADRKRTGGPGAHAGRSGPLGADRVAHGPRPGPAPLGPSPSGPHHRRPGPLRLPSPLPRTQLPADGQHRAVLPGRHHHRPVRSVPKRGPPMLTATSPCEPEIDDCGVPLALPVPRACHWLTAACRWLCPCPAACHWLCQCGGRCR